MNKLNIILIYIFFCIAGFFLSVIPYETWHNYISYFFLILIWIIVTIALKKKYGYKGIIGILTLGILGLIIENIAIITGFPYGQFNYSSKLGSLIGFVPWTVFFAWPVIIVGVYELSKNILYINSENNKNILSNNIKIIFLGTLLAVITDLVLDPGSVSLGYWSWDNLENYLFLYYNVPLINYFGWIISSIIALIILIKIIETKKTKHIKNNQTDLSEFKNNFIHNFIDIKIGLISNIAIWTSVNFFYTNTISAIIGLLFMIFFIIS